MTVAFIGLGSMGLPLARLIVQAGLDLAVYDPVPDAMAALDGRARTASSAADAADGADIVCLCVRDDKQVREVVAGLGDSLAAGAVLMIHSTVSIGMIHALQAELASRGVVVVDAPVSRTRQRDDERFVFAMIGGEADAVARVRPVVEAFATDLEHVGPLGAGMATKIANNMVTWVQIVVGTQAVSLASSHGVPYEKLRTVMTANGNLTPTMRAMLDGRAASPSEPHPARDAFMASQAGIGEKDLQLAIDTGAETGLDMVLAQAASGAVRDAMTQPIRARPAHAQRPHRRNARSRCPGTRWRCGRARDRR